MTSAADATAAGSLEGRQPSHPPRFWWAGYALAVWSLLYMLPHAYWAAGGTALLGTLRPRASEVPAFDVGNWVVSGMLIVAAAAGVMLARGTGGRLFHLGLLAVAWIGCALCTAHGIYGVVDRALIVSGVSLVDGQSFAFGHHGWVLWDMFVYEPWFIAEGVLFGLTGWVSLGRAVDRRRWSILAGAGVGLALLSALFEVRVG